MKLRACKKRACKKIVAFTCVFALVFLTGCAFGVSPEEDSVNVGEVDYGAIYSFTDADRDVSGENAQEITFAEGQTVYTIDEPGVYLLKGSLEGQLQIDVEDRIVHLILEDVEMKSQNGPVIYVKSAAKAVMTVPEGSNCILTDTAYYDDAETKACIYSESDLTINGGGSLQVYGYYKDAIRSKDTLKLLDISLSVEAKGDGLRGNDGVAIYTETLDIQCEGTGIYTEKQESKKNKGFVDVASGSVSIIAGEYGIDAAGNVYIHDSKVEMNGIIQNINCLGEQYIEEGCLE